MKQILKNLYFHCGLLTRPLFGGIGHILMLHRVSPPENRPRLNANLGMEITPNELENIIGFFARRGYEFISLDQLVERLQANIHKRKFVVFTFDDGYADNLLQAYPVFKRHSIPFTIYIATSYPDRQAVLWWYILEELLLERDEIHLPAVPAVPTIPTVPTGAAGQTGQTFRCSTPEEKESVFFHVRSMIMQASAEEYHETVNAIFEPFGLDLYRDTAALTLSWGQIKQLSQDPLVTIGGHTVNHYALSKLHAEEALTEMRESKQIIENHIQEEVRHFAFPFGGRDEAGAREFALVKEAGYTTGVTTRFANIFPGHKHHIESLPRVFVPRGSDEVFFKQVTSGTLPGLANRFKRLVTV